MLQIAYAFLQKNEIPIFIEILLLKEGIYAPSKFNCTANFISFAKKNLILYFFK